MKERIQKILAARGVASRRAAEGLISAGRVRVNGETARLGDSADNERDVIEVDGKEINTAETMIYIMLNKPRGYITSLNDEKGRRTVRELVGIDTRIYPVGRLDYDSEGLLLLTNDGELTNKLTHPSYQVPKTYAVRVRGALEQAMIRLQLPFVLDGAETSPAGVTALREMSDGGLLSITIKEGRNRQIRRMCEEAGLEVLRLKRIAVGELTLDKLPSGRWRHLTKDEVKYLRKLS